jgi:hypothetical protein
MNTKNKKEQKSKGQRTEQENGSKKQERNAMFQEHEHPEARLTR